MEKSNTSRVISEKDSYNKLYKTLNNSHAWS